MDKETAGLFGAIGGGILLLLLAIAIRLAVIGVIVWAIVKLVMHFTGGGA